jgi:hypothetical protein
VRRANHNLPTRCIRWRVSRFAATLLFALAGTARAQVDMYASINDREARSYCEAMGAYFKFTPREVLIVRRQQIRDQQIPVVLFIARHADVLAQSIIDQRLRSNDFVAIAARHRLGADEFHFPVESVAGKPYEEAYGRFAGIPKELWGRVLLTDNDIINLVNLCFLAEHYRCAPTEIMKLRSEGRTSSRTTSIWPARRQTPRREGAL